MIDPNRERMIALVALYDRLAAIGRAMQEVKRIREQAGGDVQSNKEVSLQPSTCLPDGLPYER